LVRSNFGACGERFEITEQTRQVNRYVKLMGRQPRQFSFVPLAVAKR